MDLRTVFGYFVFIEQEHSITGQGVSFRFCALLAGLERLRCSDNHFRLYIKSS